MRRVPAVIFACAIFGFGQAQLQGKTICIDPGHPSEVGSGTRGKKVTEIQVAWTMAQLVKSRLQRMGAKVVLTKSTEQEKVLNRVRAEIANRSRSDFMLRLHCDAATGSGFTTYFPTQQGSVGGVQGPDLKLLRRLPPIAERFHRALSQAMKGRLPDLGLKSDTKTAVGGRQGALTGSIYSQIPVVLVELVVLTNPVDEAFITNPKNQAAFADALCKGVIAAVSRR